MRCAAYAVLAIAIAVANLTTAFGQAKIPTADEVKSLQAKFNQERQQVVKEGIAERFQPGLLEKADELAKKAESAMSGGRMLQAAETIRQARWQLPYQPKEMPPHISRVLGNLRLRHGQEIVAVAYSPDGLRLATASKDHSVKIWDLANGHELLTYLGHKDQVRCVAFSPDGSRIASAGAEKDIRVWDPATGKDAFVAKGQGQYVTALEFAKDGKFIVATHVGNPGGAQGLLVFYDAVKGEAKQTIDKFPATTRTMAFNPDGSILAVGDDTGGVRLYQYPKATEDSGAVEYWSHQDPTGASQYLSISPDNNVLLRCNPDGAKFFKLHKPGDAFGPVAPIRTIASPGVETRFVSSAFSRDGKTVFLGSTDGVIRTFDAETGNPAGTLRGHTNEVKSLTLNPAGNQLASAGSDYMVRLWDFDLVMQARDYAGHEGSIWSTAFRNDGKRFVTASADRTLRVWEVGSPTPLHVLKGHKAPATIALFSPDGKRIVSAAGDKLVKVWDAETGAFARDLSGHGGTVTALDFAPGGAMVASGSVDKTVRLWNPETGDHLRTIDDLGSIVSSIAFSYDGKMLAVGTVDQSIRIVDPATGKTMHRWAGHSLAVSGLAFSPDGKWLASCGADQLLRAWPMATPGGNPVTFQGHSGPISSVAFKQDSLTIASAGADQIVKLWKIDGGQGKEMQNFRGHRDWVASVTFSKDGFYLLTAGVDRQIKIWEITSKEATLLPEHTGAVESIAFSPDGSKIASGSSDKTVKLWDSKRGVEIVTIPAHGRDVISLSFFPDGKTLYSSGVDRNIKVWDVETGKEAPRSPIQQQNWTGLINSAPLIQAASDKKKLLVWIPGDQRYTTIGGFDAISGAELFMFNDQGRKVNSLAFALDGAYAATGGANGVVRVWNLEKKQQLPGGDWTFFEKDLGVADLGLTPDGKTIVVTSDKGDVKIADVAKREVKKELKASDSRILACVISPDGKRFVTVDGANMIKLWELETGRELRSWNLAPLSPEKGTYVIAIAFSPDGKHVATANANTTAFVLDLP
ncbi:MAG: hypothetical protein K2X38_17390 [Gemmataceae bacterium]|nr:hypothetical protein [Gemmataceae bacterium]